MKLMIFGDLHIPFINWDVARFCADYAKHYKPDLCIQMGDTIDAHAWSLYQKATDSPNASDEWENTLHSMNKFHGMFNKSTPWKILDGNHTRRIMLRASEANLPPQLIKTLSFMFPYENWSWHISPLPLVINDIAFVHGDECPGTSWQKAQKLGMSLVQGHTHTAHIHYINTFRKQIFGMDTGTLMDSESVAGRYAVKNPMKSWMGLALIDKGIPSLIPYR